MLLNMYICKWLRSHYDFIWYVEFIFPFS
jgi:hypothetical protein